MSIRLTSPFLRRVLAADASISGATGLLMVAGAPLLGGIFELPAGLVRYIGLVLLPFAAGVWYLSGRRVVNASTVRAVIAANIAWVGASALVLLTGLIDPNALGTAFVILQAIVVAGLAELQYAGLRRSGNVTAAAA
jgi:hypothetical protein